MAAIDLDAPLRFCARLESANELYSVLVGQTFETVTNVPLCPRSGYRTRSREAEAERRSHQARVDAIEGECARLRAEQAATVKSSLTLTLNPSQNNPRWRAQVAASACRKCVVCVCVCVCVCVYVCGGARGVQAKRWLAASRPGVPPARALVQTAEKERLEAELADRQAAIASAQRSLLHLTREKSEVVADRESRIEALESSLAAVEAQRVVSRQRADDRLSDLDGQLQAREAAIAAAQAELARKTAEAAEADLEIDGLQARIDAVDLSHREAQARIEGLQADLDAAKQAPTKNHDE